MVIAGPGRGPAWLARLFFPVLLAVVATMVFTLDLGRTGDDHGAYMRNPETGQRAALVPDAKYYFNKPFSKEKGIFWRPLFTPWFLGLTSLMWNHVWAQNLIDAALHVGVGLLVFALLRALRIGRAAALITMALFLVYPAPMQVVFWKSSSGTSFAAGLMLVSFLAAVAYARCPRRHGLPFWLAVLGFATPGMNEQPAPALAAIPLFFLAGLPRGWTWRGVWPRLIAVTAAPGLACALYAAMMMTSGPSVYKTVKPADLGPRLAHMAGDLGQYLRMQFFAASAFDAGVATLRGSIAVTVVVLVALAAAGFIWLRRVADDARAAAAPHVEEPRHRLIALAALTAFFLSCMPIVIVAIYPNWESRYLYAPATLLALLLGVGLDLAIRAWMRAPRPLRAAAGPVWALTLGALLAAGAITTIGVAEPYRRRANADIAQGEALRSLVPDPPHPAFFMPMLVADVENRPGGWRWSLHLAYSSWMHPWSIRHRLPVLYKRIDVCAGYGNPDVPRVLGVEADGLRYQEIMPLPGPFHAHPAGGYFVPWASVVPFIVAADGSVSVVTRLRLPDGREIDLPALKPLVESGHLPPRTEPLAM